MDAREEWLRKVRSSLAADKAKLLNQLVEETKVNGRKTYCLRGHRYADFGVKGKEGYWHCRKCAKDRKRKMRSHENT